MSRPAPKVRDLLHEPLVRFGIIGAVIFASLALLNRNEARAPRRVVSSETEGWRPSPVPEQVIEHGDPERWLDDEILAQRARELGLDEMDLVVRRRLAQQMRFFIADRTALPEPSEAELQRWLDDHPDVYARPPELTFEHVFFSRGKRGDALRSDADTALRALRTGDAGEPSSGAGDPFHGGARFEGASETKVRKRFGPKFASALFGESTAPSVGKWSGPHASAYGLHLVRITSRTDSRPAQLDEVRQRVRADLRAEQRRRAERAVLDALRADYGVPPATEEPAR